MTLQDSTFHLPRGEAGDFNPFTAKPFRMVEAPRLELRFNAYQAFVLTFELNFLMAGAAGFEPALFAVGQYRRSLPIAYTPEMVPAEGGEPPYAAYKTAVLPLNDAGMEPAGGFKPP